MKRFFLRHPLGTGISVFRQSRLCDVVLVVEDLEIPAHKAVLAACSPYFYAMFTTDLSEAKADRIVLQVSTTEF